MKTTEITVDCFIRKHVRDHLREKSFKTRSIEFIEIKYILSSKFIVRGSDCEIERVNADFIDLLK